MNDNNSTVIDNITIQEEGKEGTEALEVVEEATTESIQEPEPLARILEAESKGPQTETTTEHDAGSIHEATTKPLDASETTVATESTLAPETTTSTAAPVFIAQGDQTPDTTPEPEIKEATEDPSLKAEDPSLEAKDPFLEAGSEDTTEAPAREGSLEKRPRLVEERIHLGDFKENYHGVQVSLASKKFNFFKRRHKKHTMFGDWSVKEGWVTLSTKAE